jgi:putative glutamine amidotransferase
MDDVAIDHRKRERPIVLVTGPTKTIKFAWWATRFQLWRAGLQGVYLSPGKGTIPDILHGVIIGGGNDIDPKHYGATGYGGAVYDAARDQLELEVIALALKTKLPMLGICRGAQLINVSRGGTLIGDLRPLRKLTPNRNSIFPIKQVTIESGSSLHEILSKQHVQVNSLHNQAVDKLGDGLDAVGHDNDGFVQAIESSDRQFVIGVQWHPEYLIFEPIQSKLFKALAVAAKKFRYT